MGVTMSQGRPITGKLVLLPLMLLLSLIFLGTAAATHEEPGDACDSEGSAETKNPHCDADGDHTPNGDDPCPYGENSNCGLTEGDGGGNGGEGGAEAAATATATREAARTSRPSPWHHWRSLLPSESMSMDTRSAIPVRRLRHFR